MNLIKKIIGAGIMATASIALTGCVNFYGTYANADKYLVGTQYYDGELTTLDIDWTSGKVTLIQDESAQQITVREDNNLEDDKKVHSYFNDGTLSIKYCKSGLSFSKIWPEDKQLFVTFPKLTNLDLDITSGSATINKLDVEKIDISVTSGSVDLEQATAKDVKCKITSGNLNLGIIKTELFTSKLTSGKTTIDSLSTKEGTFNSTSGNLKVNVESADKLSFGVTSGDIDLTIPEAGAAVTVNKTSGKFNSTREHTVSNNVYTFGDGSCTISIKVTSGNITIR